ncbi:peptidoglycan-binding LysM domain-containing protein [Actinidia rufa]|uniref:Peptidoglycan-binding LysM domain-containing protein n=1 Tax=Actinidia rufa TaxID=165716 RepID=A0A7J0F166_9ERIC|nr:peptidoglycan-binding LysM domain-containing protein [Actinidia rufa]
MGVTKADAVTWSCAIVLVGLITLSSLCTEEYYSLTDEPLGRNRFVLNRPCDEVYVVGEGETLHTISDKCSDPFIVERNPHINDPDDVFPGLVIQIVPYSNYV